MVSLHVFTKEVKHVNIVVWMILLESLHSGFSRSFCIYYIFVLFLTQTCVIRVFGRSVMLSVKDFCLDASVCVAEEPPP